MSSNPMISVQNVSKVYRIYENPEDRLIQMATLGKIRRFKEFAALHDVSLEVERGETVGIIGRNGCGKSTLLQLICGTLRPSKGSVKTHGRIAALLELGAGFNREFTGRENVYMNGAILGFTKEEMDARFAAISQFAAIGDFIERPVKTYSSGMYVRLAFAVAISVEPEILIVDEALAVGDEAFQRKCYARIEKIKDNGGTILFVTHSANTIVQICDRAILFDGGEKILDGVPKTVVANYQKLINAPPEFTAAIRAKIKSGSPLSSENELKVTGSLPNSKSTGNLESTAYFDENLKSASVMAYVVDGAEISNVHLVTSGGLKVNNLVHGHDYELRYTVKFLESFKSVSFASLVKTMTGVEIAGQFVDAAPEKITVQAGYLSEVRFFFKASFLPGAYFLNAGVYSEDGGVFRQLHRIVDAVMFRVIPTEHTRTHLGIISIQSKPAQVNLDA